MSSELRQFLARPISVLVSALMPLAVRAPALRGEGGESGMRWGDSTFWPQQTGSKGQKMTFRRRLWGSSSVKALDARTLISQQSQPAGHLTAFIHVLLIPTNTILDKNLRCLAAYSRECTHSGIWTIGSHSADQQKHRNYCPGSAAHAEFNLHLGIQCKLFSNTNDNNWDRIIDSGDWGHSHSVALSEGQNEYILLICTNLSSYLIAIKKVINKMHRTKHNENVSVASTRDSQKTKQHYGIRLPPAGNNRTAWVGEIRVWKKANKSKNKPVLVLNSKVTWHWC